MKAFSSVYAFTASRLAMRGTTCITNDAQGKGSGVGLGNNTPVLEISPPPCLFKYAAPNLERISRVIKDGMVYFSSPLDFNDPFDCRSASDISTLENRKKRIQEANNAFERFKKKGWDVRGMLQGEASDKHQERILEDPEFAEWIVNEDVHQKFIRHTRIGVCCLAEQRDNVLMWAHYAKNHEGVCFEFDLSSHIAGKVIPIGQRACFPFEFVRPVKYHDAFPYWNWGEEDLWTGPFFTKSKEWKYEKEWRAPMFDAAVPVGGTNQPTLPGCEDRYKGVGEYQLDDGLLSGVILGCRISDALKRCVANMAKNRGIKIWQASIDESKYGLNIKPYLD